MRRFVGCVNERPSGGMWAAPKPEVHHARQVLYRGYVANSGDILDHLHRRNVELDGSGDAALFAAAHLLWGNNLSEYVLGEYALAIYDPSSSELLLTRDGLGIHPLFYSCDNKRIVFGTHLEELLRVVEPGRLDEIYLGEQLLLVHWSFERTPFRNISNLILGRSIVWSHGQLKKVPAWNLSQARPVRYPRDGDYEERFRELLYSAVRNVTPTNRKVWATLSGGLDSSSIVCAAKQVGIELETLSFIFTRSHSSDERQWMAAVAKQCGYPRHQIDSDQYPPFSELPTEFYGSPNLVAPYAAFFRSYEAYVAKHDVEVVLSGGGGDHVLIGDMADPIYLADNMLRFELPHLWSGLKEWQNNQRRRRSLRYLMWNFVLQPSLRYFRRWPVTPRFILPTLPWIDKRLSRALSAIEKGRHSPAKGGSPGDQYYLERIWDFSLMNAMNTNQVVRSVEVRYPLVYRPLVEFSYGIPWTQKLSWDSDRFLQRRALLGVLPEKVRLREDKMGPTQAVIDGFRHARDWWDALAKPSRMADLGLVDEKEWKDAVRRAQAGQIRALSFFLQGVSVEWWLQTPLPKRDLQVLGGQD
jgi:asparagine synthase (glutamine-hydrolysing)